MVDHATRTTITATAEVIKANAKDIYKDALQPAAKQIGETLETVGKTVNMLLAPVSGMVWGYEKIIEIITPLLEERLKSFANEKLKSPEPYIAVPAIYALSYSYKNEELQRMYANLIATSMLYDHAEKAHPAFVEIIKQMSPLDAKIFSEVVLTPRFPIAKICRFNKNAASSFGVPNIGSPHTVLFSHLAVSNHCDKQNLIALSLDNLLRLKLIEINYESRYSNNDVYFPLITNETFLSFKIHFENKEYLVELLMGTVTISPFGYQFYNTCVKPTVSTEMHENTLSSTS